MTKNVSASEKNEMLGIITPSEQCLWCQVYGFKPTKAVYHLKANVWLYHFSIDFIIRSLILFFILGMSFKVTGQNLPVSKILKEKNDSIKCLLLMEATDYYKFHSTDTLMLLAVELEKTARQINSFRFLEAAYNIKSMALKFKGQFPAAMEYAQKSLNINNKRKDKNSRPKILLNYADLLRQQKQFDDSERYHREGLTLSTLQNDTSLMAKYMINIGLMFGDMQKSDSVYFYYKKGIQLTDKKPELLQTGITARLNLSQLLSRQGKYEEMISLARQVYDYGVSHQDADHISLGANNVALGYYHLKQYEKALEYIKHAEDAARIYKSPQNLLYALGTASDIHADKGDYKSAYLKALAYIGLKDSIRTALYDQNLMEITTKYEVKEKESLLAQHQLTIQKQSARQRMIIWLSSILLLIGVLLFLYLKNRQDLKRKTAELEAEKARLAAQMEHAEVERLQQLDELRSNFFANISHEFRTPLTLILNPAELLLKEKINPDHKKYLQTIYGNASRMLELINQLLDLSKLESGKTTLKVSKYNLKQFCVTLCGLFESFAIQKELEFEVQVPHQDIFGYFDKDVLEKILVNLISNAFKFTSPGGKISFILAAINEGDIEISVRDTGIGISRDNMENLFNRFMSFTDSEVQKSSGIGLSLVQELVTLHKGTILVESEIGTGSVFTIRFPISKGMYKGFEIQEPKHLTDTKTNDIHKFFPQDDSNIAALQRMPELSYDQKPLLLIAEDNVDIRHLLTNICKDYFQVLTGENGKIAFEIAREKIPDIIITDIMMPEMDGNEFCRLLREDSLTSHIPVIMLTARGDQKDKLTGLKTGADDYLTKPFNADELLVRLHNLLEQRKKLLAYYKKALHSLTPTEENIDSMDAVFLKQLKDCIEKNLHVETFGVSELASELALSRSQLHRKITGLMGYSPNEVIRIMRLEKAKMMIQNKIGTIAEIAYMCGFSSPAYFSKCYKDHFGHTAGEEI